MECYDLGQYWLYGKINGESENEEDLVSDPKPILSCPIRAIVAGRTILVSKVVAN